MAHYAPPTLRERLVVQLRHLKEAAENWGCEDGSDRWLDIQAYTLALSALPDDAAAARHEAARERQGE